MPYVKLNQVTSLEHCSGNTHVGQTDGDSIQSPPRAEAVLGFHRYHHSLSMFLEENWREQNSQHPS